MKNAGAIVGLLILGACNALPSIQGSPAPENVCDAGACSAYAPEAGATCRVTVSTRACQISAVPYFVLVVTAPPAASSISGSTYAISRDQLFAPGSANVCGPSCFQLGRLAEASGGYLISEAQAEAAARNLGNPPGFDVTLPVSVTYFPQWTPPDTATARGTATDARLLNLPLPPVFANVAVDEVGIDFPAGVALPGGSEGYAIDWFGALPPATGTPNYVEVIQVSSPFDDGYPDIAYTFTSVAQSSTTNTPTNPAVQFGLGATFTPIPPSLLPVSRADGKAFDGVWKVFYRDQNTLLDLTSRARLSGTTAKLRLNQISTQLVNPATAELVMEPPRGAAVPTLVQTDVDGLLGQIYPAIPPVAHVSGQVRSPEGTPVSATLLFYSTEVDDVLTCQGKSLGGASTLVYQTTVQTADALTAGGAIGSFSLDLPQGHYNVIVDPSMASGYAKQNTPNVLIRASGAATCTNSSPTVDLSILAVSPLVVTGSVATVDGRPLANATVELTPAAFLALGRLVPLTATTPGTPEDLWPRPYLTTTTADGRFDLSVDPHGEYDLTVRPQDGTNFPWVVRPKFIPSPNTPLEPLVVPPPYYLSLSLEDPQQNPLAGAVVQAYGFSQGVAILIGDALTDSNGSFSMMLSTAFATD